MDYDKTCELCLKKMFHMVGERYPNEKLTDQKDWYTKRTWPAAKEERFRVWMRKLLKKRYPYMLAKKIDFEIGMFLLMWGWKTV